MKKTFDINLSNKFSDEINQSFFKFATIIKYIKY